MKKNARWPLLRRIAGIVLIVLGIPGLVLPGLQGIAMITAGLVLLGNQKLLNRIKYFFAWLKEKLLP